MRKSFGHEVGAFASILGLSLARKSDNLRVEDFFCGYMRIQTLASVMAGVFETYCGVKVRLRVLRVMVIPPWRLPIYS
jgi:hypothetical protein